MTAYELNLQRVKEAAENMRSFTDPGQHVVDILFLLDDLSRLLTQAIEKEAQDNN